MKRCLAILIACLLSIPLWSADKDDVYVMGWGGYRVGEKVQFGFGVGYVPVDAIGFGLVWDQSFDDWVVALEGRWFLEPVEFATSFGLEKEFSSASQVNPILTISGDYLWALTSSLAARASLKWQIPLRKRSNFFLGAGFRILF